MRSPPRRLNLRSHSQKASREQPTGPLAVSPCFRCPRAFKPVLVTFRVTLGRPCGQDKTAVALAVDSHPVLRHDLPNTGSSSDGTNAERTTQHRDAGITMHPAEPTVYARRHHQGDGRGTHAQVEPPRTGTRGEEADVNGIHRDPGPRLHHEGGQRRSLRGAGANQATRRRLPQPPRRHRPPSASQAT
jgi:hypothetical protein